MAKVTVIVNNKNYTLACDDGQEEHLSQLAAQIDNRIAELAPDVGETSDASLLLMAGLTLADDLAIANERIVEVEEELAGLKDESAVHAKPRNGVAATLDEDKVAGILESAARRMEDIAARLG